MLQLLGTLMCTCYRDYKLPKQNMKSALFTQWHGMVANQITTVFTEWHDNTSYSSYIYGSHLAGGPSHMNDRNEWTMDTHTHTHTHSHTHTHICTQSHTYSMHTSFTQCPSCVYGELVHACQHSPRPMHDSRGDTNRHAYKQYYTCIPCMWGHPEWHNDSQGWIDGN